VGYVLRQSAVYVGFEDLPRARIGSRLVIRRMHPKMLGFLRAGGRDGVNHLTGTPVANGAAALIEPANAGRAAGADVRCRARSPTRPFLNRLKGRAFRLPPFGPCF